ncbi:MAG: DUF3833 family protein [Alphaproteobacteria bacterium]|nr:DUF3833 family protein [Alphaproteobacteria bacterium]
MPYEPARPERRRRSWNRRRLSFNRECHCRCALDVRHQAPRHAADGRTGLASDQRRQSESHRIRSTVGLPIREVSNSPLRFVPEQYFVGRRRATGFLQYRSGAPRRSFEIDLDGRFDRRTLTLDEVFRFGDGAALNRAWRFTPLGEGSYEATGDDVVGKAPRRSLRQRISP